MFVKLTIFPHYNISHSPISHYVSNNFQVIDLTTRHTIFNSFSAAAGEDLPSNSHSIGMHFFLLSLCMFSYIGNRIFYSEVLRSSHSSCFYQLAHFYHFGDWRKRNSNVQVPTCMTTLSVHFPGFYLQATIAVFEPVVKSNVWYICLRTETVG